MIYEEITVNFSFRMSIKITSYKSRVKSYAIMENGISEITFVHAACCVNDVIA